MISIFQLTRNTKLKIQTKIFLSVISTDKKSRQSQKVNDYRRYLNTFQSFIGKHSTLVRHVAKFFVFVLDKKSETSKKSQNPNKRSNRRLDRQKGRIKELL